ncbi:MAG: CARDB domain-containing protein [Gammaproteobacteria bacterium]|nr:CARDB domain-containing protein [Gammaproteobacteria bacterium]
MQILITMPALADGTPVIEPFPITGAFLASHREDAGNVAIIDFIGDYNRNLPGGELNLEPRAVVAREFFRTHPDEYDFLVVFTTFEIDTGDAVAFHLGVQNDVQGIGLPAYDNSTLFGSRGRLLGYIDMAETSRHELDPQRAGFEQTLGVLGHEMMHQWSAFVSFVDETGVPSDAMLGKDGSHWSDLLHSDASVMYGHKWEDAGDGTFKSLATLKFYSQLDLYLAGIIDADEVAPWFLIESPGHDTDVVPAPNAVVSGTRKEITIDDVIAAEGPRIPAAADSPKDFRIAYVLLTAPGETVATSVLAGLRETARRYTERFTAWTGGRASAQVATRVLPPLDLATPPVVEGGAPRAGGAVVADGLAWLRAEQQSAGFWQDRPGTRVRDTVVALESLSLLDPSFTRLDDGLDWLGAEVPESTDYLARQSETLSRFARDASAVFEILRERKNDDGAWGIAAGFESNPLDTALTLSALARDAPADANLLADGHRYLLASQNDDGGWSSVAGGPSRINVTATVIATLGTLGLPDAVRGSALDWLAGRQNADGGFGDDQSTVHDTALVLLSLIAANAIDRVRGDDAALYLLELQDEAGSWQGSTYKTALAVRALQRFNFPNWRFIGGIAVEPASPVDGDRVRLTVTVSNDANVLAPATVVRAFDGDPGAGGTPIGDDVPVPALAPGDSVELDLRWDTFGLASEHRIVVVVDPDAETPETSEGDNRVERLLGIAGAPTGVELAVVAGSVSAVPANPDRLPATLGISATIRNVGDAGASDVQVRLYEGSPEAGMALDTLTLSLPARSSLPANFTYELARNGETRFTVVVDPDGVIAEADEDNNRGETSVTTTPSVDLEVLASDISVVPNPALLGSDAVFRVVLRNRGTSASPSTPVTFLVTDGNITTELLLGSVEVPAGATVERVVPWRVNLSGDLTFTAQIDPDDLLPELDELNNTASLAFDAGLASGPNLVISFDEFSQSPNPALEGQPLELSATIRNTGTTDATGVEVAFFDGDPDTGGTQIGARAVIPLLAAGAASAVEVTWGRVPGAGEKLLFVVADPDGVVAEFSEDDNRTFAVLTVLGLPDLAVSTAALTLDPPFPARDAPFSLTVAVTNLGTQPAADVVVRVFEGEPGAGGQAIGGDQRLDLAGGATAGAAFTLALDGMPLLETLVVVVDPEDAIEERSELNNSARLSLAVQDGDFFVSERFISPNGDGVRDVTRFFFRLDAPSDVVVAVVDEHGDTVRGIDTGASGGEASGDVIWDGLDDLGRVVNDGRYRIQARGAGALLGEATVEVDNNRSSLVESIGTPYGVNRNLTCGLGDVQFFTIAESEDTIVFDHPDSAEVGRFPRGILAMSPTGANVRALVPITRDGLGDSVRGLQMSEAGDRIVYIRREEEGFRVDERLFLIGTGGGNASTVEFLHLLEADDVEIRELHGFSGALNEVVLETSDSDFGSRRLVTVPLDGGVPRVLIDAEFFDDEFGAVKMSPDRTKVAVLIRTIDFSTEDEIVALRVVDIASGAAHDTELPHDQEFKASDFAWSPDSRVVAVRRLEDASDNFDESEASPERTKTEGVRIVSVLLVDAAGGPSREIFLPELDIATIEVESGVPCTANGAQDDELRTTSGALEWSRAGDALLVDQFFDLRECAESAYQFGKLYRVDVFSGEAEELATLNALEAIGANFVLDPTERAVFFLMDDVFDDGFNFELRALRFDDPDTTIPVRDVEPFRRLSDLDSFPTGRQLLYRYDADANDPASICFSPGAGDDYFSYASLLNLTADLRALRSSAAGGVLLQGTASDLNFEQYVLEYRADVTGADWRLIAPASGTQALDETLTVWVPPAPGRYQVRLTATDRAGNRRSATARVSWAETPDITDVFRAPNAFSPNGDGVLDEVTLSYRVLQPVRLELQVFNARGDRVRTIVREHTTVGSEQSIVWDGRNDAGVVVADGRYTMEVQDYQFFVTLDRTPPQAAFELTPLYRPETIEGAGMLVLSPPAGAAEWAIVEENYLGSAIERAGPTAPDQWEIFFDPDPHELGRARIDEETGALRRVGTPVEVRDAAGARFRLVVEDDAGNRTVVNRGPVPEQLIVHRLLQRRSDGTLGARRVPFVEQTITDGGNPIAVESSEMRFVVASTVAAPLSVVNVQYRLRTEADWQEQPLSRASADEYTWFLPVLEIARDYAVRLRAIDVHGNERFSNSLAIRLADGIEFGGRAVLLPLSQQLSLGLVPAVLPDGREIIFAIDKSIVPLAETSLYLQSGDDPRYANELKVQTLPRGANDTLRFAAALAPCSTYNARLEVTTTTGGRIESRHSLASDCLALRTRVEPVLAEACGAPSPNALRIRFAPASLESGLTLSVLTLAHVDETGTSDVVFNVNKPRPVPIAPTPEEQTYSHEFVLDTAGLAEGTFGYEAKLTASNGQSVVRQVQLTVDHTPPTVAIGVPLEGQLLCGVPIRDRNGVLRNGVAIEGIVDDRNLILDEDGNRQADHPIVRLLSPGPASAVDNTFRTAGTLANVFDLEGEVAVELEAIDHGGFRQCVTRSFTMDSLVRVSGITRGFGIFSPNADGSFDTLDVSYDVDESLTLGIEVFAALQSANGERTVTGSVIGRIADGEVLLPGQHTSSWNGEVAGSLLPDGLYALRLAFTDDCGNRLEHDVFAEIDTTPPDVEISFPQPDSPLPTVVQPIGTVTDTHFASYRVEFGVGLAPETFGLLAESSRPANDDVLATWNTFGFEGPQVLRVTASDTVGNRRVVDVALDLADRLTLVSELEAAPAVFSPNGDGRREQTALRVGLEQDVELTVTVVAPASGSVVRRLAEGDGVPRGARVIVWDGRDDAGDVVPDGDYVVRLLAALTADPAVTQGEEISVTVDSTPPAVVIDRPREGPGGAFVSSRGQIIGSIRDARLTGYTVSLAEDPAAPQLTELVTGTLPVESGALGPVAGLAEGDYLLDIRAEDAAENRTSLRLPFTVDDTPPVVALETPAADAVLGAGGGPVEIVASVDEEHPARWILETGEGAAPPSFSELASGDSLPLPTPLASWDLSTLDDGVHVLRLSATDRADNATSVQITINVDNTPPVLALVSPADGEFVSAPAPITGSVDDAHPASYRLALSDIAGGPRSELAGGDETVADALLATWELLPADGDYDLYLEAEDRAGNRSELSVRVTVDTLPPAAPRDLLAEVESERDVGLVWSPSPEIDLAGYAVYRGGVRISTDLLATPAYLDAQVDDGRHEYTVTAFDLAGLESEPSAPVAVVIDTEPPRVRLAAPADGALVSGVVEISGTAASDDDFKEYRLHVAPASAPDVKQLLRRSPVPVAAEALGEWDTTALAEGASFVVTLEGEDLSGNVATATVTVVVDNTPPGVPTGLTALATGNDVRLDWDANTESDLLGYLLFRDERLANVDGVAIGDLDQFALADAGYDDDDVTDGVHAYAISAIDRAGNVSDVSAPVEVVIDTRAPSAVIVRPVDGTRFEGSTFVAATVEDSDVGQVQFEIKRAADSIWLAIGAPDTSAPWSVILDPGALGLDFDTYHVRAVATDVNAQTDPDPAFVTLVRADLTRPAPVLDLTAQVDGDEVGLAWSASPEPDVIGYHVEVDRGDGEFERVTASPHTETSFADTDVADGSHEYRIVAVDASDNESDPSDAREAVVYTPVLDAPFTPTLASSFTLAGRGIGPAAVTVEVTTDLGTTSLPGIDTDAQGTFDIAGVALSPGPNLFSVQLTDAAGNVSKPALLDMTRGTMPSRPAGLTATPGDAEVTLDWNANPEPDLLGYFVYRDGEPLLPELDFTGNETLSPDGKIVTSDWGEPRLIRRIGISFDSRPPANFDVEVWSGVRWVPFAAVRGNSSAFREIVASAPYRASRLRVVEIDDDSSFVDVDFIDVFELVTLPAPGYLDDSVTNGAFTYTVSAVSTLAFESEPSDPAEATVGDVEGPEPVTLSVDVAGSDVSLTWTDSASDDVDFYVVYRDDVKIAEVSANGYDETLPNGTYVYTVRGVDQIGNQGEPSNEAVAVVAVAPLAAPVNLTVTAPPEGETLALAWSPAGGEPPAGYRVLRALDTGGPYAPVGEVGAGELGFVDTHLDNGVTYYYVVAALDGIGNAGELSDEASGVPADLVPPGKPVIDRPTRAGEIFVSNAPAVDVAGSADSSGIARLYVNGELAAEAPVQELGSDAEGPVATAGGEVYFYTASLSPDGRYLAYLEYTPLDDVDVVKVFDFDTASARVVEVPAEDSWVDVFSWSPDSRQLIFALETWDGSHSSEIHVYDVTSGNLGVLPGTEPFDFLSLHLSPDGSQATAVRNDESAGTRELWIRRAGAADFEQLTSNAWVSPETVRWSPDGRLIAYSDDFILEVIDVESGDVRTGSEFYYSDAPDWSPDGRVLYGAYDEVDGESEARIFDPETGAETTLLEDVAAPRWLAGGARVLFLRDDRQLFVLDLDSGVETVFYDGADRDIELYVPSVQVVAFDQIGFGYYDFDLGIDGYLRFGAGFRFEVPGVSLDAGDNVITAVIVDESDNASEPSDAIVVVFEPPGVADLSLAPGDIRVLPGAPRAGEAARVGVTIANTGNGAAPAAEVSLMVIGPDGSGEMLLDRVPLSALEPGENVVRSADWRVGDLPGIYSLVATADPDDRVAEQSEANNFALREIIVPGAEAPAVSLTVNGVRFGAGDDVTLASVISNSGPAFSGSLELLVEDAAGFAVATVSETQIDTLAYAASLPVTGIWNTASTFAGAYRALARLRDTDGTVVAEQAVDFEIDESASFAATVTADRPTYGANQTARITGNVAFATGNRVASALEVTLRVVDAADQVLAERSLALGDVLPGTETTITLDWNTGLRAPGAYTATILVEELGEQVAEAAAALAIAASPLTVSGTLALSSLDPTPGTPQRVSIDVANGGNVAITALPLVVALVDPARGVVIDTRELALDIPVAGNAGAVVELDTSALALRSYAVQLSAVPAGESPRLLAAQDFRMVDRIAPTVAVRTPTGGAFVPGNARVAVFAVDGHSAIARVEIRLDGGAWLPVAVQSLAENLYGVALPGLADGAYLLEARAFDSAGNRGIGTAVAFTVSNSSPAIVVTGIADGEHRNAPVTPMISITDAALVSQAVALNGASFVSGNTVAAEGDYVLSVFAANAAGNSSEITLRFTIDTTPPVVTVAGVADGDVGNTDVVPVIEVSDDNLDGVDITLDGAPFFSGSVIDAEGSHRIEVDARDLAGNATLAAIEFVIDKTPPRVDVSGVVDGQVFDGGEPYRYDVEAVDADGDPLEYRLSTAPAGMHIDPATGLVTFRPTETGDFTVSVRVTDPLGAADSQTYVLTVTPPDAPPAIISTPVVEPAPGGTP